MNIHKEETMTHSEMIKKVEAAMEALYPVSEATSCVSMLKSKPDENLEISVAVTDAIMALRVLRTVINNQSIPKGVQLSAE